MRAPRAGTNPDPAGRQGSTRGGHRSSDRGHRSSDQGAAALLDFAVTQITMDRPLTETLPPVLGRLVTEFGLHAAIAFRPAGRRRTDRDWTDAADVLAAHPPGAAEPELLERIGRLPTGERAWGGLVVYSVPVAVALIGDGIGLDDGVQATAHAVAALVAAQLRENSELARMSSQTEWLDSLVATAIPGVLMNDERGLITHISKSFGTMFDVEKPDHLKGTPAISVIRQIRHVFADPAEFVARTTATIRSGQPSSGEQITAADGRTIECDYWPVHVGGRYLGGIWLLWDMSDRTEIDREREQQNLRLSELAENRNQFVAMVSHELRTPLTSIVSFSELIKGEAEGLTPDGQHFLEVIDRNAGRMLRIIDDLLLLSRLEAGGLPLDLALVHVPDLVHDAVRIASDPAARQDISVDARISGGPGPAIFADGRRLLQALDNLIGNAVKFSHRHGQVHVNASCDGQTWRIDVVDSGIGIPPEEAAMLFDRFVRASNARTAGLPGTGLGLSIVKTIVEMHRGRIVIDTTLNRGTTFSVFLPVARWPVERGPVERGPVERGPVTRGPVQ